MYNRSYSEVQRYVFILFDEMKIQGSLIWDKHSGELISYVDLGDPDVNFATLERGDNLASHILLLMVRDIATISKHTFGYFATANASATQLFPLFWKADSILEMTCKLSVVGATGDGATSKRKLFKMHAGIQRDEEKEALYCTKNLFCPERNIYFLSDVPHLLKKARNCLFNSGAGNQKRQLWNSCAQLKWNHISDMFYKDLEDGLHLLPRITTDHIELNSYSLMKVNLAAQVLSQSVAETLKNFGPPDALATADFCQMMDKFFDCFNVCNLSEGERRHKESIVPYTRSDDIRFTWLTDVFLQYLAAWKDSIDQCQGHNIT